MEESHQGWKLVRGVRQDVVNLFREFSKTESVRYEDFCKVWKEFKFSTIFNFRFRYIQRLEFIEELFHIVKEYLRSVYEFQIRAAALYTLYGLYNKQPLNKSKPVKIRFTKLEWDDFQNFVQICKAEKHYDILFIYCNLHTAGAYNYVATARATGLEMGYRKYWQKRQSLLSHSSDIDLLQRPLLSENLISSFIKLESLYCKKKREMFGEKSVELIDPNFSLSIQELLKSTTAVSEPTSKSTVESSKDDEFSSSDEESLETVRKKTKKSKSNKNSEEDGHEVNSVIGEWKSKGNSSMKYLLAKKQAEFYLKKLKEAKNSGKESTSQEKNFMLPELDL